MTVKEMSHKLNLKIISKGNIDREVTGVYICDLLSRVMSQAKSGDTWITVMTNVNIAAVASLVEISSIIIPEDIAIEHDTVIRAQQEGINILSSTKSSYEPDCVLRYFI